MIRARYRKPVLGGAVLILLAALVFFQPAIPSRPVRIVCAVLFQCIILAAVIGPCAVLVKRWLAELGYRRRESLRLGLAAGILGMGGAIFFLLYFSAEQDIKVYDYSTYWIHVIQERAQIADSIPGYLSGLRASFGSDYNNLPSFPLLPVSYLFGVSYTGYCLSVFFVYYLPACLLLTVLVMRITARVHASPPGVTSMLVCLGICATCPVLLWPVIHGYLDVAGVFWCAMLLNDTLDWDGMEFAWKRNAALAVMSMLLVLSRRWYAYYIVGFYLAIGLAALIRVIRERRPVAKSLGMLAANLGMIAGLSVAALLLVNPGILTQFFGRDYSEVYSAYKNMATWQNLLYIARYVGYLGVAVCCMGAILLCKHKEGRLIGLRLLIAAFIASALFFSVQNMAFHHMYLIIPTILLFLLFFVSYHLNDTSRMNRRLIRAAGAGILVLCLANLAFAYVPSTQGIADFTRAVSTRLRSYPVRLPHYAVFKQMAADLNEKTGKKIASVYVVGEGDFSPEHLRRINLPEQTDAAPFVLENANADLRDGFPSQVFMADYVVLIEPFTTSFANTQQVSYQVHDMFLGDPLIPEYYDIDTVYTMDESKAYVFRKTHPADRVLIDALRDRLYEYYPDDPFVYTPNYFLSLIEFDQNMHYYNYWGKEFYFNKPENGPLQFALRDTATFSTLSFALECDAPGLVLTLENQDGVFYRSEELPVGSTPYALDIAGSEFVNITIMEASSGDYIQSSVRVGFQENSLA